MLVGREQELSVLNKHFLQMLDGKGSILFLTGEAGLGKTTLVHTWRNEGRGLKAEGRGMRDEEGLPSVGSSSLIPHPSTLFLEAACSIPIGNVDVGEMEALQPWADVVTQLNTQLEKADVGAHGRAPLRGIDLKKLIHDSAPAWAWSLPLVGGLAHAVFETSRLVQDQRAEHDRNPNASNQQQVFQQYVNLLTKISAVTPLVIFLDDMHWADASSCNLLFYLSRQIVDKRILILTTFRQDDAYLAQDGKGHPIIQIKNEILRYKVGKEIQLGMLGRSAIREFLEATFPEFEVDDRFETWLSKISDGNSLFVTQFIETLREDGHLDNHGKFVGSYDTITIPDSALAVVEERTRRLSEETRDLLCFATAEGEEFTTYVLERLTKKDPMALLKDLQKATKQGLITERGESRMFANTTTEVFGFSHALFHQALYNSLILAQRNRLHRTCYDLLKTEWDRLSESKSRTSTLATKLILHAEKCGEWASVADVALETANQFWNTFAERETLEMTERVLNAADQADRLGTPVSLTQRGAALLLQSVVHMWRGRFGEARTIAGKALETFEHAGDELHSVHALINLSHVEQRRADYPEARRFGESALIRAEALGDRKSTAAALAMIGGVLHLLGNDAEARVNFQRALEIYESLNDQGRIANMLNAIGLMLASLKSYDEAMAYYTRSLKVAEIVGDNRSFEMTLNNMGNLHLDLGNYQEGLQYLERALAMSESIGDVHGVAICLNNLGLAHTEIGSYGEALTSLHRSLAIRESIDDKRGMASCHINIGNVHNDLNENDKSLKEYQQSLALSESIGDQSSIATSLNNIGNNLAESGLLDEAFQYYRQSLAIRESIGDQKGIASCHINMGDAFRMTGDFAESRSRFDQALSITEGLGAKGLYAKALCMLGRLEESVAMMCEGAERMHKRRDAEAVLEEGVQLLEEMKSRGAKEFREDLERVKKMLSSTSEHDG